MTAAVEPKAAAAAAAVAKLHAAGDDAEALAEAIQEGSFLDDTPGDARQKLRAARTKLKQLAAAASGASGAAAAAQRSPHARADYSASWFDSLTPHYEKLAWRMISKPGGATVKPDDFYRLYALHMQATRGDNAEERPMWAERGGLDFEGRARWDAWAAVKGLETEKAKLRFVKLFHEFSATGLYKDGRKEAITAAGLPPPADAATAAAAPGSTAAA